jgi:predicted TPR repeat methyltransferase
LNKCPDLRILATDVSPNMLELAEKNNPKAEFQNIDCRKISQLKGRFDAVICGFCLPYLSMEDSEQLMYDSNLLLNSDGFLYLSTLDGDYSKSGFEVGGNGDQCYVYYHEEETLKNQLIKNGFELIANIRVNYPKGEGQDSHLILIGRKKSDLGI